MEKIDKLSQFQVKRDPFSSFLYTCGIKINYFTHFTTDNNLKLDDFIVNQFKIIVVEQGECYLEFPHVSPNIELKAGDLCVIPPMTLHRSKILSAPISAYEIFFEFVPIAKEYELIKLIALAKPSLINACLDEFQDNILAKIYQDICDEKNASYISLLNFICQVLAKRYYNAPEINNPQLNAREVQIFKAAYAYLEDHIHEAISVADLCSSLAISQSYLFRAINNIAHISPSAFIHKYKMIQAEKLLKNTNISIENIALDLGYNNIYYFSTTFKKAFGISPNNYRKSSLELF